MSRPVLQVLWGLAGFDASLVWGSGRWSRHLELRCAARLPGSGGFRAHSVPQGTQLIDGQDLISIRLVHKPVCINEAPDLLDAGSAHFPDRYQTPEAPAGWRAGQNC
jgi:hypothetical protein